MAGAAAACRKNAAIAVEIATAVGGGMQEYAFGVPVLRNRDPIALGHALGPRTLADCTATMRARLTPAERAELNHGGTR
ncbi:hypothetical protein SAMN04487766_102162 [Actinomyces ruminicola]|uniref:Uncharacterized protein n=1 Tax=Actinomyces ruminicola TaxID=332524 RepID=A0A1G9T002_9ACTO|nr:hypothetical protein SAMN04487766_102162 [Actinomyces ruminicola]